MKHLILGTAGHIDHGKTALVKALTGIDTDRLKEEKARGITIELGFAHLELEGSICFGIVDVPGHEKFVRTMVAGVGGMDLVMLVIAADEGIMPQTREHLDILKLLGVTSGLVALTKSDLVEREWLELVTAEIREFVTGTFLEEAPLVPVSSRSGAGLDQLKTELGRLANQVSEKRCEGHFRLPVDRVFTMAGFGTIVTGTLLSGEMRVGDILELLPSGHGGRIRGIQAYGTKQERGLAGQRLAVNLQGIDLDQVQRGDVLVPHGTFRTTGTVDVRLDHLASAPRNLKHRSTLRFHTATSEVSAQIILLGRDLLKPGESAYAQLRLGEPLLLLSGDRYLLRLSSPSATLGGGVVLDPFPPRRRRRSQEALQLLDRLNGCDLQRIIPLLISQSLLSGIDYDELTLRCGAPRKNVEAVLTSLLSTGEVLQMTREPRIFLSRAAFEELKRKLLDELDTYLSANPLREGIGKQELKNCLPKRSDQRFFTPLLVALERESALEIDRDIVTSAIRKAPGNTPTPNSGGKILELLTEAGNEPPTVKELMERCNRDEKSVRDTLDLLARNGSVVRVSHDLFYAAPAMALLRAKLVTFLKEKMELTPADFRELTGLSRKFLIPLLAYFDSEKLTMRVGEKRVLRKR
ncbi:MAG: selenocysteine-specific translation elongation factor [Desulfuromonadales bacterium]|nr:selenocysteine-specific translation elongation factor [Desulfuromonadales bacterium]